MAEKDLSAGTAQSVTGNSAGEQAGYPNARRRSYYFKNAMEALVVAEVETTLSHIKDACRCDYCFSDVCAIVLNHVAPFYATSRKGELFGKTLTLNISKLNNISDEIFKAIKTVQEHRAHQREE